MTDAATFADLGLETALLVALDGLGYEEPTPIQAAAIPHLLAGRDVLGQAATGTGKTAAFALPILHAIAPAKGGGPLGLIVTPTRELAVQVSEAVFTYGQSKGISVLPVFGGQPIGRQIRRLERGVDVVVATPGRAVDLIARGSLDLSFVRTVVLDEADEMLDMGFSEDIDRILEATPEDRQTVLFSATMPRRIIQIAERHQRDPIRVEIGKGDAEESALIRQSVYTVDRSHKASALGRILDVESPDATIVFCRTRHEVDRLCATMNGRGYRAEALHGGMDQAQRDRVMGRLREGVAELLVATDVAARGLDVDTLTHVVNFDVPTSPEVYVHRIGRVGRAGREGVAITLAEPRQRNLMRNIERLVGHPIPAASVPTVADLRQAQIASTVEALQESLGADDLDDHRPILHALAGEDPTAVALAAIRLVHEARGARLDEEEIPEPRQNRDRKRDRGQRDDRGGRRPDRSRSRDGDGDTGFLYISLGRRAGVRPADLVGAIANETKLSGRQIGPIRIADSHSVVGVPAADVDRVISSMRRATVRGKDITVRRFVD